MLKAVILASFLGSQTDTLAASAAALAMRNVKYEFRLGQKLLNSNLGE